MRAVTLILVVLLVLLQWPLWLGKGSWLKVWDLNRQVEAQQQTNQQTRARNPLLDAEVRDLKQGTEAIEERARSELGMIRQGETFVQVIEKQPLESASSVHATRTVTPGKRLSPQRAIHAYPNFLADSP